MNALVLLAAFIGNDVKVDAMPQSVGSGVITGGWNYVLAAYSIFWIGLALYAVSLIVRTRAANKEQE